MSSVIFRRNDGSGWDVRYRTGDEALISSLFLAFMTGTIDPEPYEWLEDGKPYPMAHVVESAHTLSKIFDIAKQYAKSESA